MNTTIYATILTGFGIVVTMIVAIHTIARTNQQETNRRIDELKRDIKELLDARFNVVDSQFRVVDSQFRTVDSQFEAVGVREEQADEYYNLSDHPDRFGDRHHDDCGDLHNRPNQSAGDQPAD